MINHVLESMKNFIPLDIVVNKIMADHAKVCGCWVPLGVGVCLVALYFPCVRMRGREGREGGR